MLDRMQWWHEARYGMFIHWGVYAIPARGEWLMYQEHIAHQDYAPWAQKFSPKAYDPDEWVALAKSAGMRYMVLTTRHHDGFSLFDTQVSEFSAVKVGPKRDLVRDYVEACHRGGMRVGFYYSLLDWRYPAYFRGPKIDPAGWKELVDYMHAQVRELCSQYGKIDILWYDGGWPYTAEDWRSQDLNAMVRQLQPEIIINNRSQMPEDFGTPEQHIRPEDGDRAWEACMTLNDSWGYHAADENWKSAKQVIINLVRCASLGGNFLLNIGPKPDGTVPPESVRILRLVGRWLESYGGSIYGTSRSPFKSAVGMSTIKGNTLYQHVLRWPGREITFAGIKNEVSSVHLLTNSRRVQFSQDQDRLTLTKLPVNAPDDLDTVIAIELDGTPQAIDYFVDGWSNELAEKADIALNATRAAAVEAPDDAELPDEAAPESDEDQTNNALPY